MNDRSKYRIFYDNKIVYPNSWNDIKSIYECLKQQAMWDCKIDTDIKFDHIANNLIFMQCMGLKDKNGKLIYEGDVVKFKNTDNKYCVGTIKYTDDDALFYLSYKNENNRDDWDYVSKYRLEVIGNIYENKDLLESESK